MNDLLRSLKPITVPTLFIFAILLSLAVQSCGDSPTKTETKGLSAAKMSATYLRDLQKMILAGELDPAEFDRKSRWARQEADDAKRAGFDNEVTDNLYCSLAGYGTFIAGGTGLVESDKCLRKAESILKERYGNK